MPDCMTACFCVPYVGVSLCTGSYLNHSHRNDVHTVKNARLLPVMVVIAVSMNVYLE